MDVKLRRANDREKFDLLHPDLQRVIARFSHYYPDYILIESERGKAKQEEAHKHGHSNAHFGQSPHNYVPALAADIGPYKYPGVLGDYHNIAIAMFAAARDVNVAIEWGGDWKTLKDWPHFQLAHWKTIKSKKLAP